MQNAAGDGVAQAPHDQNDAYRAVVSNLVSLVDDVSPRYMKAAAALRACDVNLGIALRSLLDPADSDPYAASLPALSVIGA